MRFSSGVSTVIPQPVEIEFIGANGRVHTYTPDYLVYYRLGDRHYSDHIKPMLVEVKPAYLWREKWRDWSIKWKTARRYAAERGWQFCIYDESRIRGQALQNIVHLERYERMAFDSEDVELVINTLREMGIAPVHYLLARHFNGIYRSIGISLLWHLVATHRLDCDIREPLNENLELWVAVP
ncbi:TnsA endonuclease N-terminal domain-containing protein [Pseudomonas sp. S3_E10]